MDGKATEMDFVPYRSIKRKGSNRKEDGDDVHLATTTVLKWMPSFEDFQGFFGGRIERPCPGIEVGGDGIELDVLT